MAASSSYSSSPYTSVSSFPVPQFPDVFRFFQTLPPPRQWPVSHPSFFDPSKAGAPKQWPDYSVQICDNFRLSFLKKNDTFYVLAFNAKFDGDDRIHTYWTFRGGIVLGDDQISCTSNQFQTLILQQVIEAILSYSDHYFPSKLSVDQLTQVSHFQNNMKKVFNLAFLLLTLIVCSSQKVGKNIKDGCSGFLSRELLQITDREGDAIRRVSKAMGLPWCRSVNLLITNYLYPVRSDGLDQSPLFSHSTSEGAMWTVHVHCPVVATIVTHASRTVSSQDDRLMFSLKHHHIEGVMQFKPRVVKYKQKNWIDVIVNVDNIRLDITQLLTGQELEVSGVGPEKHFPSKISINIKPGRDYRVLNIHDSKSLQNSSKEIGYETSSEVSLDFQKYAGIKGGASSKSTINFKPWEFKDSVLENTAKFCWTLRDLDNGNIVSNSSYSPPPPMLATFYKHRWKETLFTHVERPFTPDGGVKFGNDEYKRTVAWRFDNNGLGKNMDWEIEVEVLITYWPNLIKTTYSETRRLAITETLCLNLEE